MYICESLRMCPLVCKRKIYYLTLKCCMYIHVHTHVRTCMVTRLIPIITGCSVPALSGWTGFVGRLDLIVQNIEQAVSLMQSVVEAGRYIRDLKTIPIKVHVRVIYMYMYVCYRTLTVYRRENLYSCIIICTCICCTLTSDLWTLSFLCQR